ncbi:GNAT family N-acetyltransferase [Cytobacillus purgationiresistens]|uniref:GNAT superfamily N-acetyltransferase n=1 Tax=Cytobacillus purgationiresistens TaxID=863449 RepID=A0ABU0AGW8_9BACI|nr:GNAT family N-acetyltransferase [Cytobacillus purgationiresistens]MDQ0270507.1 GNAT superfamily N-acetyltransferase [Cytobacillus purgationiresistens]
MEEICFRQAEEDDLERIVEMLADDKLGSGRETLVYPLPESYRKAFYAIQVDPNNELIVAEWKNEMVGVQQLTFTPYLTHQGSWRATIEGVRIAAHVRGQQLGHQLISWAIERAKKRGCRIVQLTTDNKREEALRFYEDLGFQATHQGLKLHL